MTFKEVLHEVVTWIEKDRRVSYRAIKRQFEEIDDEYLEDLKDAIVFAHPIELLELGFLWKGAEEVTSESDNSLKTDSQSHGRSTGEAERRRITVMFCDLSDSTRLSQQLDAEDLREVVTAYQSSSASVIHKYGGYIAQYLGDGLLVYFGWPKAHENEAERAVLTALEIVESITTILNKQLLKQYGIELSVRIGIHAGPVVVGEVGGAGRYESLAMGDTVNIASRLEALAESNSIIISEAAYRLVADDFEVQALGPHSLKGVSEDVEVYSVTGRKQHTGTQTADSQVTRPFLVGREEELGLLNRRWEQALNGFGQIVLLSGPAGIGKSGLVHSIRAEVHESGHSFIAIRCSPYHQNSAYSPLIRAFEQAIGYSELDSKDENRKKVEQHIISIGLPAESTVPYLCKLLNLDPGPDYRSHNSIAPQKQKQLTSDALVAWLFKEAQKKPMLTIWEDLHWADPSTLEVVALVADQIPTVPMLAVYTYRPQFIPKWRQHSHHTPIVLSRLELSQINALISKLSGDYSLPQEVIEHIVNKTDGVPLFVEELTKMLLDSDILQKSDGEYVLSGSLDSLSIPDTLQDSLMARLDQLTTAKEIAQLGSVIGREFSYQAVEAIHTGSEEGLQSGIEELLSAELIYGRGRIPESVYTFKHALVQDAAYDTLLKAKRQKIHLSIAEFIESERKSIGDNQPELIAHHYGEGRNYIKAIEYWLKAGTLARRGSSHFEAIAHAQKGLQIVEHLPDEAKRLDFELDLQLALGPSLIATRGFAFEGVGKTYERARELATRVDDHQRLFAALWGLCSFNITRAYHEESKRVGEEMSKLSIKRTEGNYIATTIGLGIPLFSLSCFLQSAHQFGLGIPTYKKSYHDVHVKMFGMDMGVFGRSFGSHAAWQAGQHETALKWSSEALKIAEEVAHPFSKAVSTAYAAMFHQFRRDVVRTQELAASTIALSSDQQFAYYLAWGIIIHGWTVGIQGNHREGLAQIEEGLELFKETGSARALPYYMTLLAEIHAESGNYEQALATVESAISKANEINEHWWSVEMHRLKGDYLQLTSPGCHKEAEAIYQMAIEIARRQGAESLRQRTVVQLDKLDKN